MSPIDVCMYHEGCAGENITASGPQQVYMLVSYSDLFEQYLKISNSQHSIFSWTHEFHFLPVVGAILFSLEFY